MRSRAQSGAASRRRSVRNESPRGNRVHGDGAPGVGASAAAHHPRAGSSPHATPGVTFRDVTASAGIAGFRHLSGGPEKNYIIEGTGSGVAFWDFDNDGYVDLYLVNGSTLERLRRGDPAPAAGLFRNKGDGTFVDVTAERGVANERWGQGACVGDIDNDGFDDSTSPTSARIACTTTRVDGGSPTSRTQQTSRSIAGRP